MLVTISISAQGKIFYHSCALKDSVDKHMEFIRLNASRIFADTSDCKQALLDSIAAGFMKTKNAKYLNELSAIRQNPKAQVDEYFTDLMKHLVDNDFEELLNQLYLSKGRLVPLENELINALNMIVEGRPLKQKYMGRLNVEIAKAKDSSDKLRESYLEKFKLKIEEEKYKH